MMLLKSTDYHDYCHLHYQICAQLYLLLFTHASFPNVLMTGTVVDLY